ncbi:transmembrane protein 234-like [Actinia tenebrosa]|uniref:Transmembrane protein 234-like n=1 Tax=Actinia tenebrosa TaxID=6105 RepID=A0A6P8J8Y0_ACTTE|nr:transmembrane protein 234-like [Actinia tenebrosa]
MGETLGDAFWLIIVAIMWGSTNPLIKKGSTGIEQVRRSNALMQFVAEIKFLVFNWKYMVPFLLNQSGSVIFYLTLASADLSLAVPITNSLTFLFTILTGRLLGEESASKETYAGMALVMAGVTLCVLDRT